MQSKEEIEKAKEDFNFFNEGDYITKEMVNSKEMIFEHIKQLETGNEKAYWEGYIRKQNEAVKICEKCKYIKKTRELENELNQLNTYILINGVDETLKTATQIKVENQHEYLHQKEIKRLKSIIDYLEAREKKLIEKLEEDIEDLEFAHDNYIDANVIEGIYETLGRISYAQKILKILKGENDGRNKE